MTDDPAAVAMAEIREELDSSALVLRHGTDPGARLLAAAGAVSVARIALGAVDAVLAPHSPRTDRVLGVSCFSHRNKLNTLRPQPGCGECTQDGQREVCPECRDEFGDPVPFGDCRARKAALAALTGKGNPDGR